MSGTRTVVYVAATMEAARTGGIVLSRTDESLNVEPATTPDEVRIRSDTTDCVVFAETPTTNEGARILEVIDAADGIPLVCFTDRSFDPDVARSTEGISGYVRRDTPEAVAHLADEIRWHCADADGAARGEPDPSAARRHRQAAELLAGEYTRLTRSIERETAERLDRESDRDRFRTAFAAYPDPACAFVVGANTTPLVSAVTDSFRATFGLDPGDIVGTPVVDAFEDAGIALDASRFRAALDPDGDWPIGERERGEARSNVPSGTDRGRTLHGRVETVGSGRDLTVTVVPPDGSNTGVVACTDVTDRRQAERALADRTRRLDSIADLLGDGLREPLGVARGYLEVAEETCDREHFAEVERAHETISEATDALAGIVGHDAVVTERDSIILHDLARDAWGRIDTGEARLTFGRNGRFTGDREQLREVFEHLIEVATAGADPVVSVGTTDDGFYVSGTAAGDGNPFADAVDETGVRLDRIERVAEAHGWRLGVAESEEGTAVAFRGVAIEIGER